jgi:Anti-sigma factor NepR
MCLIKRKLAGGIVNVTNLGKSAELGPDVQLKIGQQLRTMYDEVLREGVPDRFVEFLNRLDHKREDPCRDATSTAATATQ